MVPYKAALSILAFPSLDSPSHLKPLSPKNPIALVQVAWGEGQSAGSEDGAWGRASWRWVWIRARGRGGGRTNVRVGGVGLSPGR